jgi:uncharacterized SAM-binding protein YcdF (DUF218 family)
MLVSQLTEQMLTDAVLDRLLFDGLEDTGAKADCIIVLGSTKAVEYRVPVAAQLYHRGRAPKMMMCGGMAGDATEADRMRIRALELGVPQEAILTECCSQNTIENILFSMTELQRSFWLNRVHDLLLVTTPCHMRRSLCIARYLYPAYIAVHPCPAEDRSTRRHNWMLSEKGRTRVMGEALNLIRCVQNGVFPDFEI